ncbi:MAG TPA: TatD family hydrolase [Bacteroidales bacterium]|jgi:TatD DNase family protein|nr:TatD family hydrolase [Bacteroidales bacterium]HOS71663.1 TatD family hydrolase [Bacteroidales bacterium]HQH23751.1 TatD family hydrolase [Bacteroidales bacterium]HQJ83365.1 TatD family hydrolase [Bacteroidales bacterium]
MSLPDPGDYIDIHTHHGTHPEKGIFSVVSLMAHEEAGLLPLPGIAYTFGIHPWHLSASSYEDHISGVRKAAADSRVLAIGEAGFDRLRGPDPELQRKAFEEQALIAAEHHKPVIVHCVRAWDELLRARKRLRPARPWLVHGFRGSRDLAAQLISKDMFLSFWFGFIIRPEAGKLIRSLPRERIFLETDGSGAGIRNIYVKVSADLDISVSGLKRIIYDNFMDFFG